MDKGAVETWLARTFRHSKNNYSNTDWTFYCTLTETGRLAEELRSYGATVVASPVPFGQKRAFLGALRSYLMTNRFDVLHCHHDFLSGFYLWAAAGLPIKQRWVHVHNTDESLPTPSRWKHRLLLEPLRQTCLKMAGGIIGISNHVLDQFLRHRPRRPGRDFVRYYGVDVSHIQNAQLNPPKFRHELGLPHDAKILVFVGRMSPLKNPVFVVDILAAVLKHKPNVYAIFVGEGDLTSDVMRRGIELGVSEHLRMLGWRDDTATIMKNSDVFVFPRPETPVEGLGLVVVESQACGLPMVTTSGISDDAIVDPLLVTRIPLDCGEEHWASNVIDAMNTEFCSNADAICSSRFDMETSTTELMSLYKDVR